MKNIILSQGKFAIVDDEDFEFLNQWKWTYGMGGNGRVGYAHRRVYHDGTSDLVLMHRLLSKAPDGMDVDHINGDKLDNRKSNLRVCTQSQNMMNRGLQKNNKSGFKGVSRHSQSGKWWARIAKDGKKFSLGLHHTPEEAGEAYRKAAESLHGEYARL